MIPNVVFKTYKDPLRKEMRRRFFYHWFKQKNCWSVHFAGTCHVVEHIYCYANCETKQRKRQPKAVMQGWASSVRVKNGVAEIWG